jgi:putative transposase
MSDAKLTRSMSRKACSPDNAAVEHLFGRLKNELFYPRDWKSVTIEQLIEVVACAELLQVFLLVA